MFVTEIEEAGQVGIQPGQHPLVSEDAGTDFATQFLDNVIPLRDASHCDVVRYSIEIPMRYAECFAILQDGRKVGLVDRRRFVGWLGDSTTRSYLFRKNLLHIELRTDADLQASQNAPGGVYDIILASGIRTIHSDANARTRQSDAERKFVGIDGSQVTLPGRRLMSIAAASRPRQ